MKKPLLIFIVTIISVIFCGCDNGLFLMNKGVDNPASTEDDTTTGTDESFLDSESMLRETYRFIVSPYTAFSRQEAFDTVYECEYFFLDGVVAGIHATTTLPDKSQAEAYFEAVLKKDPLAEIEETTVSYHSYSEDLYFDGYSPEKLQFALEKAGYEVDVNFDIEEFNKNFGMVSKG